MRAEYWRRVHHMDRRAVTMADRHYSRQNPGSPEFTRPGHKIVLLHTLPDGTPAAVWTSHRPAPGAGVARMDGRDVWDCAIFRIEARTVSASTLIREAVAITRGVWEPLPRDGFYTTINPRHVAPIKVRGREVWGYSYLKAGWLVLPERTKRRNLIQLIYPPEALGQLAPVWAPWDLQSEMFREAA